MAGSLEQQALTDGFAALLVGAARGADGGVTVRLTLSDGGRRQSASDLCLAADAADPQADLAPLAAALHALPPARHLLAAYGNAWRTVEGLLIAATPEADPPHPPWILLRPVAARLAGLPGSASTPALAAAYGLAVYEDGTGLAPAFHEDLLWALVHAAAARGLGYDDLAALNSRPTPTLADGAMPVGPEFLEALPDAPGVYTFADRTGQALYVGKAASLVRRLADYVRATELLPPKLRTLRAEARSLEYRLVGSELEALLLENRLIAELQPRLNTQRSVVPDSGRYPPPEEPVVLVAASLRVQHRELFLFGARDRALQVRVNLRRPPVRRLEHLLRFALDSRRTPPPWPGLTDWGADGNAIACRYWARLRHHLTWSWLDRGTAPASLATALAGTVRLHAAAPGPAEFRLGDAEE